MLPSKDRPWRVGGNGGSSVGGSGESSSYAVPSGEQQPDERILISEVRSC